MNDEHSLKQTLPFAECRYSKNSDRHYKSHLHKAFCVGAIDQGAVIYQFGDKTARLQPGSLALINPETLHSCNPTESSKRSYYVLFLDVEWCLQVQQSLWQLTVFNPVNTVILEDNAVYRKFITTMELLLGDGDLLEKEHLLVDITETIFLRTCVPAPIKNEPALQMERLKLLLNRDLETDTSLRELALELQANPYTLLRQFKASTGITPHAYRLNCRIEHAKRLLREGKPLSEVALECGFFDQSHLHRYFKALTTLTPKEYQVNFVQ